MTLKNILEKHWWVGWLIVGFLVFYLFTSMQSFATKEDVQKLISSTSAQYVQIDSRLNTIDGRIATSAQGIQQVNTQLQQTQNSLSGIENKVTSTNSAVNNILIYSVTLAIVFSLAFNLAWKLFENRLQINNDFGGITSGILISLIAFVFLIILGIVRLST